MQDLKTCTLAMKCIGNFEHFNFLVKCFDENNRFFSFDYWNETNNLVLWNFPNKNEMNNFIQPLKKEIETVLWLIESEKMAVPDISFGIYNVENESILLI